MKGENKAEIYQGVRRNSPCPCGSGKRFKSCHGGISIQEKISTPEVTESESISMLKNAVFCTVPGKYYPLDTNDAYLYVSDSSIASMQLDVRSCYILQELEEFSTFEGHYLACQKATNLSELEFSNAIESFYQQGLIKSKELIADNSKASDETELKELAGICIRTCDSPEFLERILNSQVKRKNKFEEDENIYVFDDSSDKENINKNIEIVSLLENEINLFYFGLESQKVFTKRLIDVFPEKENIIKLLLLPQENVSFSGGRIMNLALLFFAGKRYLNFDDDFILDEARVHCLNIEDEVQVGRRSEKVYDGFEDLAHVMKAGSSLNIDPLSQHKILLGTKLLDINSNQDSFKISKHSYLGLHSLNDNRYQLNSFVITTGNGWFGTTGNRDGRFIFTRSYKDINPPWETAENFKALFSGGYCWDSARKTEIVEHGLSTPSGINNTQLLAPTVSTCKSEDTLLCTMTSALYPNSVHLGFSWALGHFRRTKSWKKSTFQEGKYLHLTDVIASISHGMCFQSSVSSYDRLKYIGAELRKVSDLSFRKFKEKLKVIHYSIMVSRIEEFHKNLECLNDTNYVKTRDALELLVENDLSQLSSNKFPSIEDALGDSEKEKIVWAKNELHIYSEALEVWPELWDYCATTDFKIRKYQAMKLS